MSIEQTTATDIRQIRKATVFMASVTALAVIGMVIMIVVVISQLGKVTGSSVPAPQPSCMTQGGWDTAC